MHSDVRFGVFMVANANITIILEERPASIFGTQYNTFPVIFTNEGEKMYN
jgi:hypothetical protein